MKIPLAKAYLFDMDGTIVNNCHIHVLAWQAFSRKYGNELSEKQILDWMGATNRVYQERMLGRTVSDEECVRLTLEKERTYRDLYRPLIQLAPGLREFLDMAHQQKISCAVVSGAPAQNIDFVFDALNLRDDFPLVVNDGCYTKAKPDPDCYLTAAKKLGLCPSDCIVFEDAVNGVRAGKDADMFVVAITHTVTRQELATAGADLIIDSFEQLLRPPTK